MGSAAAAHTPRIARRVYCGMKTCFARPASELVA
jgi:hypothetical protein